jgi:uncharacterized membrane protein YjfL (UPF0719 family)
MSAGEKILTVMSIVFASVMWARWYLLPAGLQRLGASRSGWRALRVTPAVCVVLLLIVLRTAASHDVRDDIRYLGMYLALGAAWIAAAALLLPVVGVSVRDDVLERANPAAAYAVGGALIGVTLAFAGGNIGDGPGWWVVLFASGLATLALYALWLVFEQFTDVSDHVTIERDPASGLRLGGLLVACGLILGRAAAGDWVSAPLTVNDFVRVGFPALGIVAIAIAVEMRGRPTMARTTPSPVQWGVAPAGVYVALAAAYVAQLGLPE